MPTSFSGLMQKVGCKSGEMDNYINGFSHEIVETAAEEANINVSKYA